MNDNRSNENFGILVTHVTVPMYVYGTLQTTNVVSVSVKQVSWIMFKEYSTHDEKITQTPYEYEVTEPEVTEQTQVINSK